MRARSGRERPGSRVRRAIDTPDGRGRALETERLRLVRRTMVRVLVTRERLVPTDDPA